MKLENLITIMVGICIIYSCGPSEEEIKIENERRNKMIHNRVAEGKFQNAPKKINKLLQDNFDFFSTQIDEVEFNKISHTEYEFIEYDGGLTKRTIFNKNDLILDSSPDGNVLWLETEEKYLKSIKTYDDGETIKRNMRLKKITLTNKRSAKEIFNQLELLKTRGGRYK